MCGVVALSKASCKESHVSYSLNSSRLGQKWGVQTIAQASSSLPSMGD